MTTPCYPPGCAAGSEVRGSASAPAAWSPGSNAWVVDFDNGNVNDNHRDNEHRVLLSRPRECHETLSLRALHTAYRAAGAAKKPRPKPAVTRAKAAPKRATTARPAISFGYSPPAAAAAIPQTPAIAILHFHDGVRIGPMVASASGISQMPFHVDLSAAQLDELCSWRAATREGGAAP